MNAQTTAAGKTALQVYSYEGSNITFSQGENVMVNATEMAKPFGKQVTKWTNTQQTKDFLQELAEVRKCTSADLVRVVKGGNKQQGTWMHEDVAMEFARWLSPKFAIWCNDRIKELLTQGVATVSDDDEVIAHAMQVLQRRLDARTQELQIANSTIEQQQLRLGEQQHTIDSLAPMADYTRDVLQSSSTYTLTEVAKDLGFRSVAGLTDFCRQHRVLYRQSDRWLPTARYAASGFFRTRTARFFHSDGSVGTSLSTVVTEKGRVMLHKLMEQKGGDR